MLVFVSFAFVHACACRRSRDAIFSVLLKCLRSAYYTIDGRQRTCAAAPAEEVISDRWHRPIVVPENRCCGLERRLHVWESEHVRDIHQQRMRQQVQAYPTIAHFEEFVCTGFNDSSPRQPTRKATVFITRKNVGIFTCQFKLSGWDKSRPSHMT